MTKPDATLPLLADQAGFVDDYWPTLLNPANFTMRHRLNLDAEVTSSTAVARIAEVYQRHPSLRCVLVPDGDSWGQRVLDDTPPAPVVDLRGVEPDFVDLALDKLAADLATLIDVERRGSSFAVADTPRGLVVVGATHHLVADSHSVTILHQELTSGEPATDHPDNYDEFVAAVQTFAHTDTVARSLDRWAQVNPADLASMPRREATALTVPTVWAVDQLIPHDIGVRISRERTTAPDGPLAEFLATLFQDVFGGAVLASVVQDGRTWTPFADADDLPAPLQRGAVNLVRTGWLTVTGMTVIGGGQPIMAADQLAWGLMHRISHRTSTRQMLTSLGGPPSVFLNVIRGRFRPEEDYLPPAEAFARRTCGIHDLATRPLAISSDLTFAGVPLAVNVGKGIDAVHLNFTWDANVFDDDVIVSLLESIHRRYAA